MLSQWQGGITEEGVLVWENESFIIMVKVHDDVMGSGVCIDKMSMQKVCIQCKSRGTFPGSHWCDECVVTGGGQQ